jgi:hypothetical protein
MYRTIFYSFSYRMSDIFKIEMLATFTTLAHPIRPVYSLFYPAVKARMFPLMRTFYMAVFYRIVVYIIHVPGKILLVGNQMFQNRLCHTPRSPLLALDVDTGTSEPPPQSHDFVNLLFIMRHRTEKSSSSSGIFHIQ